MENDYAFTSNSTLCPEDRYASLVSYAPLQPKSDVNGYNSDNNNCFI